MSVSNYDGTGDIRHWSGCALLHNQMPTHAAFLNLSGLRLPSVESNLRDSKPVVPKAIERKPCLHSHILVESNAQGDRSLESHFVS